MARLIKVLAKNTWGREGELEALQATLKVISDFILE